MPADEHKMLRRRVLLAQRKVTARCVPEARVVGATPARQASELASGNRVRQLPISASMVAARIVLQRGSDRKMWASGC